MTVRTDVSLFICHVAQRDIELFYRAAEKIGILKYSMAVSSAQNVATCYHSVIVSANIRLFRPLSGASLAEDQCVFS